MYTFFMFIVFRNSIRGLNNIILYDINNLLCSIYSECSKNKQFILIKPLLIFSLAVYTCASSLVSIYYFSQELVEYWGPYLTLLLFVSLYYYNKLYLLYKLKEIKNLLMLLGQIFLLIHTISLNTPYTVEILGILGLFFLSVFLNIYINYINKDLKDKYPYIYSFLSLISSVMLMLSISLVFMYPYGPRGPNPGAGGSGGPSSGGPPPGGPGGPPPGGPGGPQRGRDNPEEPFMPRGPRQHPDIVENHVWIAPFASTNNNDRYVNGTNNDHGILEPNWDGHIPTRRHNYPYVFYGPNRWNRPPSPYRRPINPVDATTPNVHRAPAPFWGRKRRHWEGDYIYTRNEPNEGDKYKWIDTNSNVEWVPSGENDDRFVSIYFYYRSGKWCWREATLRNMPYRGTSMIYHDSQI